MKKREVLTIRDCFDSAPYEDGGVRVVDKKSASQEEQDALRSYFREMGEMQQLSAEEELSCCRKLSTKDMHREEKCSGAGAGTKVK